MRICWRVGVRDWGDNTRTRPAPLPCLAINETVGFVKFIATNAPRNTIGFVDLLTRKTYMSLLWALDLDLRFKSGFSPSVLVLCAHSLVLFHWICYEKLDVGCFFMLLTVFTMVDHWRSNVVWVLVDWKCVVVNFVDLMLLLSVYFLIYD